MHVWLPVGRAAELGLQASRPASRCGWPPRRGLRRATGTRVPVRATRGARSPGRTRRDRTTDAPAVSEQPAGRATLHWVGTAAEVAATSRRRPEDGEGQAPASWWRKARGRRAGAPELEPQVSARFCSIQTRAQEPPVSARGAPAPRPRPARPPRRPARPARRPGTGRSRGRTTGRGSPPGRCPRRRPAPPPAPRPSAGRGCRSARRAAAAWPRTAPAAGSGTAPAGRRTASRTSAPTGPRQAVAVQRPRRLLARLAGPVLVAAVQDLQQGPAHQRRVVVGLGEPARPHPRAEAGDAAVVHRRRDDVAHRPVLDVGVAAAAGQQPQEVATCPSRCCRARPPARRTRPRGRTAASGRSAPSPRQITARLAVRPPLQPHPHVLLERQRLGRPGLHEPRSRVSAAW